MDLILFFTEINGLSVKSKFRNKHIQYTVQLAYATAVYCICLLN